MLPDLAQFLGVTKFHQLKGRFVLLSDSRADGQFMVHHFLTQALKDGATVYFVAFAQAFVHYNTITSKLGANLSKFQSGGQLVYIDGLTHLHDNTHTDLSKEQDTRKTICFSLDRSQPNCLVGLYSFLSRHIMPLLSSGRSAAIIVDDLSILLGLGLGVGVGLGEVVDFVHYCQVLLCHSNEEPMGSLLTMVHADDDVGEDEEQLLKRHLAHRCDLEVGVSGLETGHSRDVHGEVTTVEWTSPKRDGSVVKTAQFKLTERNIHIFPKGLSPGVL